MNKQADADRLQKEFGDGFVPLIMDITDADAVHQAAQKVGSMTGDRNLAGPVNNARIVVSGHGETEGMHAVVPQRFKNWTLPRLLPMRMLNAYLAKQMGLKKA